MKKLILFATLISTQFSYSAPLVDYGFLARDNQFPNVVRIVPVQNHNFFGLQEISNCTGTMISSQVVLTAAHCVINAPNSRMYVTAPGIVSTRIINGESVNGTAVKSFYISSEYLRKTKILQQQAARIGGAEYIRMSEYEREELHKLVEKLTLDASKNDIALLELETPQNIRANSVAKIECKQSIPTGDSVWFAGFGVNRIPGTLNDNTKNNLLWGQNSINSVYEHSLYFISNTRERQSANSGDSGGPLFLTANVQSLFGVTVLKSSDKSGNSNGAYFNSLSSRDSLAFFKEVARARVSNNIKQSISYCAR